MTSLKSLSLAALLAAALLTAAEPLAAAPAVETKHVAARLVTDAAAVEPGSTITVGVHKRIIPKWHTYWRNSGDSGLATTIAWSLPAGATAGEIQWPYPKRMMVGPVANYGYEGEVTLLTPITIPDNAQAGENFPIRATVDWLVCEEICIPEQVTLDLTLPVVAKGMSAGIGNPAIEAARARLPVVSPWPIAAEISGDKVMLTADVSGISAERIEKLWFFPSDWGVLEHSAGQPMTFSGGKLQLALKPYQAKLSETLRGVLVMTERNDGTPLVRAFAIAAPISGVPATSSAATAAQMPEIGFVTAVLFALLGGIILNLMPCVFPILSIKVLSLLGHSRLSARERRFHGIAYGAGVLACFAVFATIVLMFKASGAQFGWGFQFQSPLFVLALAYLIFAVGLSQSGLFTFGASFSRLGAFGGNDGRAASFLAGALAAIVATPCTAPFMGAALGFAVSQPAPILFVIFLTLGLGLALPYVILCFWPVLLRFLPKPGAWMERFKQALAFPMYAVAVWLIWVLAQQAGADAVAAALFGMVLIAFGAWLFSTYTTARALTRRLASGVAATCLAGAIALGYLFAQNTPASPQAASTDANYEAYSPSRLAALRSEGRPVFVNLTAAWCITCIVNERIAIDRTDVRAAFAAGNVAYLKGDWTQRDPAITAKLSEFGRNGVPLYVFYSAGAQSQPVLLPQILTPEIVLREIGKSKTAQVNNNP